MRWPGWLRRFRRRPPAPEIQPFRLRDDLKPLEPKDPAYVVEEREMSETGMFRIFPWLKKKDESGE